MTKRSRIAAMAAAAFFLAALLFTVLALTVDVQPIGPTVPDEPHRGYSVGFAAMNGGFRPCAGGQKTKYNTISRSFRAADSFTVSNDLRLQSA